MSDQPDAAFTLNGLRGWKQPPISSRQLQEAKVALLRYRIMAFVTGVILISGLVVWAVSTATTSVDTVNEILWIAHGWLFVVYAVMTLLLAVRLRWPLARVAVVVLAGTVPTMSFVAEHFVTRDARRAPTQRQPVDARD